MAEQLAELNKGDGFPTPDLSNGGTKTSPYTATEDGFVSFTLQGTWTGCDAYINNVRVARVQILNTNSYPIGIKYPPMPVKKGDVCETRTYDATGNIGIIEFYPIRK